MAGVEDYLLEAAQAYNPPSGTFYDPDHAIPTTRLQSLGVAEHWNNPIDRKYSRNLGTGDGIELIFLENAGTGVISSPGLSRSVYNYSIRAVTGENKVLFSLPTSGAINLSLFDANGRYVYTVLEKTMTAGSHQVQLGSASHPVASGFYAVSLSRQGTHGMENVAACTMRVLAN